jgi:hypothetical protein
VPAPPAIPMCQWLNRRHLRFASGPAYIPIMDLKYWQKALREAERELDAATTRTALDAGAKKFMRAKAELKRLDAEPPRLIWCRMGHRRWPGAAPRACSSTSDPDPSRCLTTRLASCWRTSSVT